MATQFLSDRLRVEKVERERDELRKAVERLWDLCRHQRNELHSANLISDDEFAKFASDTGSVKRLETYDSVRHHRHELRKQRDELAAALEHLKLMIQQLDYVDYGLREDMLIILRDMKTRPAAILREHDKALAGPLAMALSRIHAVSVGQPAGITSANQMLKIADDAILAYEERNRAAIDSMSTERKIPK